MTGKSDDPARSGNVSPPPTLGAISAVVALVAMSRVDPVLATGTFCAVPRETRDRFVSLREGPGPKFRETRRVTPSDLLRVATERCRDGFGPTQCSLDGKWSFVADVTTASGGHARLQKGWARSTLLRHVACADDLDARADTAKKPALEPRAGTETQRGDIFSDPESIRKHVAPRRVPTVRISPADGRVLDGVAQRVAPALGNNSVAAPIPPTLPVADIDMICAGYHNSLPDPPTDVTEIAMIRNLCMNMTWKMYETSRSLWPNVGTSAQTSCIMFANEEVKKYKRFAFYPALTRCLKEAHGS